MRARREAPAPRDRRKAARPWRRDPTGSPPRPCARCVSGGSSGRKCTPSTIVSQESTISWLSGGLSTAASSRKRERGGIGGKRREIAGDELELAKVFPLDALDAVNHRCVPSAANSCGRALCPSRSRMPFTTFGSSSAKKAWAMSTYSEMTTRAGTSLANQDLIGAGAEDGAKDGIDAGQPPALGELLVDQRIDLEAARAPRPRRGRGRRRPPASAYWQPSISWPKRCVSNSAITSLRSIPVMSI